ncbi:type II toxin-antitoxin system HicB family antitoxin [Comamonas kerstersii]|uniref:type II toxin-antitoxin system HicB family antitoxin n=1 Tax=Comamonas kerstersii TaxID=225992 RepID=UPI003EE11DC7
MDKLLNYKGYHGSVEFDLNEKHLFGKILHINDLVTYEAETVSELTNEFKAAVDDYLETCKQLDKSPDKAFSGSFNIRTTAEVHKKLSIIASAKGENLNTIANLALKNFIDNNDDKLKPSTTIIVQVQQQKSLSTATGTGQTISWNSTSMTDGMAFRNLSTVQ